MIDHRTRLLLGCLTLAAGLLAAFLWRTDSPTGDDQAARVVTRAPATASAVPQAAPVAPAASAPAAVPAPSAALPAAADELPAEVLARLEQSSLRGSNADGSVRFDGAGRLIVDADLRRHLEWWLSLLGEMPLAQIRELYRRSLPASLNSTQSTAALAFFDRWVDYLQAADATLPDGSTLQRLDALALLRRQWFGEQAAEALFGEEEHYTRHVLQRQALLRDQSLTPERRAAALAELDAQLSPEQRQMRAESIDPLLLSEQTAQFDRLGIDASQRLAERSALVGADAAERLAQLDLERLDWEARMAALRQVSRQWTAAEYEARLQDWLTRQGFSEPEQRRARALLALPADAVR